MKDTNERIENCKNTLQVVWTVECWI